MSKTQAIKELATRFAACHLGKHNAQFRNVFSAGDFAARMKRELGVDVIEETIEERALYVVMW